ncbi:MAG: MATE family efflux transporter, partial [Sphingomonadales bacterium]|nr:MATE family efflux transporter [Sphingomonadales bacterium]
FGGTIVFFTASITIGLMIAMGALVSRSLGEKRMQRARRYSTNIVIYGLILTSLTSLILWPFIPSILTMLGAEGQTHIYAEAYLKIVVASLPAIGVGMSITGILRGVGDAKRSMYITLIGAITNAILDPIFIFGFDMGIEGAAYATVISRIVMMFYGIYVVVKVYDIIAPFHLTLFKMQVSKISAIAIPAVLTNIATPIGAAYITYSIAQFGDSAVAGMSIMVRLSHVIFCGIFALSGAIGPILGQNLGAGKFDRIRFVFKDSLLFISIYVLVMALILFFGRMFVVDAFRATGDAAELIIFYCTWIAASFFFSGGTFVANAAFNNLGKPIYSTLTNFGRATIGTVPFAYYGAMWYGAKGVLVGQAVGGILFGIISFVLAINYVKQLESKSKLGHKLRT